MCFANIILYLQAIVATIDQILGIFPIVLGGIFKLLPI